MIVPELPVLKSKNESFQGQARIQTTDHTGYGMVLYALYCPGLFPMRIRTIAGPCHPDL